MIIGILNQKGGAGKTTLSINLAVALKRAEQRVLLIDADPQGSALDWSVARQQALPDDTIECLHIPESDLHKRIEKYRSDYDYIIIDGAPRVTDLARSAIVASDIIVIPVQPSAFDIWATEEIVDLIAEANQLKNIQSCFVLNRVTKRAAISKKVADALSSHQLPLLNSQLSQRVRFAESALDGLSVFDYPDKRNFAADEITAIKNELLELGASL